MYTFNSLFSVSNQPSKDGPSLLTKYLSHDEEGNVSLRVLDSDLLPLFSLKYDDFILDKLIRTGVVIDPISVSSDMRMGYDSAIDSFNAQLSEISDKLFNPEKK